MDVYYFPDTNLFWISGFLVFWFSNPVPEIFCSEKIVFFLVLNDGIASLNAVLIMPCDM